MGTSYEKMEEAEVRWADGLILICSKCGMKLERKDVNPSEELKSELKSQIKERGLKGKVRAVTSSCLDVCPRDKITVAVVRDGDKVFQSFVVDPGVKAADVLNLLT